jgi:Domain of unknown function (DUF4214)
MRHAISILLTLCLLTVMNGGAMSALARQSNGQQPAQAQDPFAPGRARQHKLPPSARIGSTPERKAAWDRMTPEQKEEIRRKLNEIITQAKQKAGKQPTADADDNGQVTLAFTGKDNKRLLRSAAQSHRAPRSLKFVAQQTARLDRPAARAGSRRAASFNHPQLASARRSLAAMTMQSGCYKSVEQFVRDFYQGALLRQPDAGELANWSGALSQAQQQGADALLTQARSLGRAIFQTQEYANRGRSDVDFVYDLYESYLQRDPDQGGWDFWVSTIPSSGRDSLYDAFGYSQEFYNHVTGLCDGSAYDPDGDGLPNDFENDVADAFTPFYHVSAYDPDQFATFYPNVPASVTQLSIKQLFGQNVVSHFRVTPQGFAYNAWGQLVSVLRLDYLTIWNNDSGLVSGGACAWDLFGLDELIAENSGHRIDQEHSEVLVAAPVSDYNYNLDPASYSTYYVYTAAHEFEPVGDQSRYLDVSSSPVPAYNHVELAMSLSKHGTYTFNPDYLPLTPWEIIFATYASLDAAYYEGWISWEWYLAASFLADDVFFSCVVERFYEQGGRYAFLRINVGEPGAPLNGSDFIAVPELNRQLTTPFFR